MAAIACSSGPECMPAIVFLDVYPLRMSEIDSILLRRNKSVILFAA